jgi:hypothetical protein
MSNIRNIKLHLCTRNPNPGTLSFHNDMAPIAAYCAQFLISPTRLETLDFGLLVEPNRDRKAMPWTWDGHEKVMLGAALAQPAFMRRIKKLAFSEFVFSPNDFIRLLCHNEKQTLKSLTFNKIHLSEGSWLVFLRQLAQAVDLDHVSLSGWISSPHEGRNALSQGEAAAYYANKGERLYAYERGRFDFNPDCLVDCNAFGDWNDTVAALEEKWCVRARIED